MTTTLPVYYSHKTILEITHEWTAKIVDRQYSVTHIRCIERRFFTKGKRKEIAWYSGKPGDALCWMSGARITSAQRAEIRNICKAKKESEYLRMYP